MRRRKSCLEDALAKLAAAARDESPVSGWTHNFYRYPARFSPQFALAAIELFSKPGDLVLDPYMGGGTAVVEGVISGRHVVGNDLNSLAAFIARVKVTTLSEDDVAAVRKWTTWKVRGFKYDLPYEQVASVVDEAKTRNLTLSKARFIKKAMAAGLATLDELPSDRAKDFVRCAILRVGQWALDGRERRTPVADFRVRLKATTREMLAAIAALGNQIRRTGGRATILNCDAENLADSRLLRGKGRAALVVTSPPYPGVHVLYHRWQVDGRRETPAPYWITGCNDGQGGSFYNFGDRRESAADRYFVKSLATLKAVRAVMKDGGYMIQLVAFNQPADHLPRYLENMEEAGFGEVRMGADARIWRRVPGRKWHARQKGNTNSAKEVVLVHRAV
jgi:DNA modification methylase